MENKILEFLEMLEFEKKYSHHTVLNYREDLYKFNEYLKEQSITCNKKMENDIRKMESQVHYFYIEKIKKTI